MGLAPELQVEAPASVVVYAGIYPGIVTSGIPRDGPIDVRTSPAPGLHDVCIVPANGEPSVYADVDITGMRLDP